MKYLWRIWCALTKHKRGKYHSNVREQGGEKVIARMYICSRCDSTWIRKVKAPQ